METGHSRPRHPKAPEGVDGEQKYGETHYPEDSVPDEYTLIDDLGRRCRYILVFLVYNNKGERLQKLGQIGLYNAKGQPLTLYGQLVPIAALTGDDKIVHVKALLRNKKRRDYATMGTLAPYPIYAFLEELVFEYGRNPQDCPAMWLKSKSGIYYRLEEPAGRYFKLFMEEKRKFDVCTRILKTVQLNPFIPLHIIFHLLEYGVRDVQLLPTILKGRRQVTLQPNASHLHVAGPITKEALEVNEAELMASSFPHVMQELTPWNEAYRILPPISGPRIIQEYGSFILEQASIFGRNCGGESYFLKLPALYQLALEISACESKIQDLKDSPQTLEIKAPPPGMDPNQQMPAEPQPSISLPHLPDTSACKSSEPVQKPYFMGCDWLLSPLVVNSTPAQEEDEILSLPLQPPIISDCAPALMPS